MHNTTKTGAVHTALALRETTSNQIAAITQPAKPSVPHVRRRSHLQAFGACAVSAMLVASCAVPSVALAEGDGGSGTPPSMPDGGGEGGMGGGGGANTQSFDYTGSYSASLTADGDTASTTSGQAVSATESNTNAALAQNGGVLTVENVSLTKTGDGDDSDNCNFYGVNSIALAVGSTSLAYLTDVSLSATSEGSNGVFATDEATALVNTADIATTSDNSRGLDATYGGTILAGEVVVSTEGDHSAGIATDRGGGYVSSYDSTLNTTGDGSPLLYSTGSIEVGKANGTATESQIAAMEGLNTIRIYDSQLTSNATDVAASEPVANGVIIYQSTSGDADTATGEAALFQAVDSTLTSKIESGSMFYLTNTTANVVLSGTTLAFDTTAANLVTAAGNDSNNWGSAGSNGATVSFTGIGQELAGTVEADTISSVSLYLLESSSWAGATSIVENAAASTSTSPITVNVDGTSTWTVTESCTVSNLNLAEGASLVDGSGNAVAVVDGNGTTLVEGTSDTTVTVTGAYGTEVTTSEAQQVTDASIDRSDYDSHYGTSTAFGTSAGADESADTTAEATDTSNDAASTEEAGTDQPAESESWFESIWRAIRNFFGFE